MHDNSKNKPSLYPSESPFSFLNGIHGKWSKLDFEPCRIHTKK